MRPFSMSFAASLPEAIAAASRPHAALIAGGTELLNWMKEGILAPEHVVDVNGVPGLAHLDIREGTLHIGALARMSDVGEDARVRESWPALSQALLASASPQIRNIASMGGNLLQTTRCPYFRAEVELACNKRRPGSGCATLSGEDRMPGAAVANIRTLAAKTQIASPAELLHSGCACAQTRRVWLLASRRRS